ncbi:hypothetical protein CPB86DRAFT_783611 [Serendipita vermifera]|nr:hypothetical protein CPB86DRAFT_783611 [Serendipita vermifera]
MPCGVPRANYKYPSATTFLLLLFSQSRANVFRNASTGWTYFGAITSSSASFTSGSVNIFNSLENPSWTINRWCRS